ANPASMTKTIMIPYPSAGCRIFPLSRTVKTPRAKATIPTGRTLVPNPGMVKASSHGMAKTINHRDANARLPDREDLSVLAGTRIGSRLSERGNLAGVLALGVDEPLYHGQACCIARQ